MTTRERNKLGKQFVCEKLQKEIQLGEETLEIGTSATKSPSELLVSSVNRKKTALLRVQYSRTYPHKFHCHSSGWHMVFRHVLENTKADFFVFVCAPNEGEATAETCDYIVIKKTILQERLPDNDSKRQKFYLYLTRIENSAVDARGIGSLRRNQKQGDIPEGIQKVLQEEKSPKNYTEYLNNWKSIKEFLEEKGSE